MLSKISPRLRVLREAAEDLRYLLNRGYNKETVLRLVGDRYLLDREERLVLYRSVYSMDEVEQIKKKRMEERMLQDQKVLVDGFNVLNTIEAALRGDELILCDDGIIRDFSQVYGKYRLTQQTLTSLSLMIEALKTLKVSEALVLYESQISKSGEIAKKTREIIREKEIDGDAETSKTVDSILSRSERIVCTSDSAILLRCKSYFDLAGYIITSRIKNTQILSLSKNST
ncbi:MAG: DUF434 domain-containing protein [Nitrososphaerota archaeon]|nr:DUF434 domain-containing protein [Nitrososphaerota archaeon]